MKKIILFLLFVTIALNVFSTTWQISSSGLTFTPATLTIQQGDDVNFILEPIHDAVEVSQSVWDANGISPVIGFTVPFGGGKVSVSQLTTGIHYYICENHGFFGMKGQIIVQSVSGINDPKIENSISFYPNPVVDHLNIQIDFLQSSTFEVTLFDTQGKMVKLIVPKTIGSGLFSQSFDFSNKMTSGIYIVKITVGDVNTYRKIVFI